MKAELPPGKVGHTIISAGSLLFLNKDRPMFVHYSRYFHLPVLLIQLTPRYIVTVSNLTSTP